MSQRGNGKAPRRCGLSVLVVLTACCLLAVGSPVQAQDNGGPYGGIFGGFFVYPAKFINGGTVHTQSARSSFHVFSSFIFFDPVSKEIEGEGPFTMVTRGDTSALPPDFGTTIQGRWEARRLDTWEWIGECSTSESCLAGGPFPNPLHPSFTAGKMKAIIALYDADGEQFGLARLTIWCSLPGIPFGVDLRDPDRRGIEQYRVRILTGRHKGKDFKIGRSPTVFIDLTKFP